MKLLGVRKTAVRKPEFLIETGGLDDERVGFPFTDRTPVVQGIVRIAWNYCVGAKIKTISEPLNFQDGVLTVRVPHSQWQSTLVSMKPEIITKINKYLKKPLLCDVSIELP